LVKDSNGNKEHIGLKNSSPIFSSRTPTKDTHNLRHQRIKQAVEVLKKLEDVTQAISYQSNQHTESTQQEQEVYTRLNKQLHEAVENTLKQGPWGEGLLLQTIGKKLESLLDDLEIDDATGSAGSDSEKKQADIESHAEKEEVFISIYNIKGADLQSWLNVIKNIDEQVISRPIYSDQNYVKALVRSKANPKNEGYLAVRISPETIVHSEDIVMHDRLGNPLIKVKQHKITPENFGYFYHVTGIYELRDNRLHRIDDFILGEE